MRRLFIGIWLITGALVLVGAVATVTRSTQPQSVRLSSGNEAAPRVPGEATTTTEPAARPTTIPPGRAATTTVVAPEPTAPAADPSTPPTTGAAAPPPPISFPSSVPAGPDDITWDAAVQLLRGCQVASITQSHSRSVVLVLKDGTRRTTVEPALDLPELLPPPECGPVMIVTE